MSHAKREKLLTALQNGRRLSKQDILRLFGIWNSGDAIHKFRQAGMNIKTEMVEKKGERFALYSLEQ